VRCARIPEFDFPEQSGHLGEPREHDPSGLQGHSPSHTLRPWLVGANNTASDRLNVVEGQVRQDADTAQTRYSNPTGSEIGIASPESARSVSSPKSRPESIAPSGLLPQRTVYLRFALVKNIKPGGTHVIERGGALSEMSPNPQSEFTAEPAVSAR